MPANLCTHHGKVVLHDYRYGGIANAEVIYKSTDGRTTKSVQTQAERLLSNHLALRRLSRDRQAR